MKVKYILNDGDLLYEGIYNVFALQEWNTNERKIYISDHDDSGRYYISPYDYQAFEIVDREISRFWELGVDEFGQFTVGVPEIFTEKNFWEKYYDDDIEICKICDTYYKIGKNELFNSRIEGT